MNEVRFKKVTNDLAGVILMDATGENEYLLKIEEPFLRELDQLLLRRKENSRALPDEKDWARSRSGRLAAVPKNSREAIAAVRGWLPVRDGSPCDRSVEDALIENLKARMVPLPDSIFEESWSSERRKGGGWIVTFNFLLAGQPRSAEWIVDDVKREIRAGNQLSEELEVFAPSKEKNSRRDRSRTQLRRRRRN